VPAGDGKGGPPVEIGVPGPRGQRKDPHRHPPQPQAPQAMTEDMMAPTDREAVGRAWDSERGRDHPTSAGDEGPPLSIGPLSAGWPLDAFSNGVVTYVAGLTEGLQALGHRVTDP
jgi:hypothetical protein